MSGNKWWSTKVGSKLLSDSVIFYIFSSNITVDLHESIRLVQLKYFLAGVNTK